MNYISDPSSESLVGLCASGVINAVADAWASTKSAHIVLMGGRSGLAVAQSIDSALFSLLRENSSFEGSMLHIWFSDERFTPQDDPLRNDLVLISGFGLCKSHIVFHQVDAEGDVDSAARNYSAELALELGDRPFDAVVLSLGEDGHLASLFPGQVDPQVASNAVAVHNSPKLPALRVSLSLPRLANSLHTFIFALGETKAAALQTTSLGTVGLLQKSSSKGQLQILTDLSAPASN